MKRLMIWMAVGFMAAGCANATGTQKGAGVGAVLGAGLGAIIGHQSGNAASGALIGAAAGGLGGALVGDAVNNQFCPVCGRQYGSDLNVCPKDGTALKQRGVDGQGASSQATAPASSRQEQSDNASLPKFCSVCGRSYAEDKSYCAEDGSSLKKKS